MKIDSPKHTTITTKVVDLAEIHGNPDNPRSITKQDMKYLKKSLKDFPDMLQLREIIVDETMTVLGGNMRLLALQQLGVRKCTIKVVEGLTTEQKKEFIIKDNSQWGAWDFEELKNSWDDLPLREWGVEISDELTELTDVHDAVPIPPKDPNILVRLSFHPGLWLGKRAEIIAIMENLKKVYNCTIKVEE